MKQDYISSQDSGGDADIIEHWMGEINTAVTDSAWYCTQKSENYSTRLAIWAGQTDDGRKWSSEYGKKVFPWDGASDAKVRLADTICSHEANLLVSAFFKARVQVVPVETSDIAARVASETLLKWMLFTRCYDMLRREVELAVNIRNTYGLAIMGVFWKTSTRISEREVTLAEIIGMYEVSQDDNLRILIEAIADPLLEEDAIKLLDSLFPSLGKKRNVEILREGGSVTFKESYVFDSRPDWVALEPWQDIVMPSDTVDIQSAEWIARRELIDEVTLNERIETEGYSEEFVQEASKHKGTTLYRLGFSNLKDKRGNLMFQTSSNLIEIWHVYCKKEDKSSGATKINMFVMHDQVNVLGKDEILPYTHGLYPFVEMPRERITRCIIDSRGIPEIVSSAQSEIKIQRDSRSDRSSISILPPLRVPANRGKMDVILGPAVQIPERRPGEFSWMEPPPFDKGTIEIEDAVRRDMNEYFGIAGPGVDPNWVQLSQQTTVDRWLRDCKLMLMQTFQLMQQYMLPEEVERVTGVPGFTLNSTRDEIQSQYDLSVEFDVRDLNAESLGVKLDYIARAIVPLDSEGVIDRAMLVKVILGAVDPWMASSIVKNVDTALESEINDEQLAFSKIFSGIEPKVPSSGNFAVRLQELEKSINLNPENQARYQNDQIFKALIDSRRKALQFQIDQRENAKIGRTGTKQVLGGGQ